MGAAPAYSYFDHDADIGVTARGATLEAAFEAAAQAMFAVMEPPRGGGVEQRVAFEFEETDVELALVEWLNRLLGEARSHGLILRRFRLRRDGARWLGEGWGEPWPESTDRGVEVKGATLTMLSVRATSGGWEARCVVDV
jgi:SHS2 domain-containing protein